MDGIFLETQDFSPIPFLILYSLSALLFEKSLEVIAHTSVEIAQATFRSYWERFVQPLKSGGVFFWSQVQFSILIGGLPLYTLMFL